MTMHGTRGLLQTLLYSIVMGCIPLMDDYVCDFVPSILAFMPIL